jgi:hypothetical protein
MEGFDTPFLDTVWINKKEAENAIFR